jgi:DNA-binding PadR family transcriptional regulator
MTRPPGAPDPASLLPLTHLALQILLALADEPRHGYGIIKDIESRTGGRTSLRSGTLYTAIQRLRDDGLVEEAPAGRAPDADERRRYFRLTRLGRQAATLELRRLEQVVASGRRRALLDAPPPDRRR